jgi:cell wall-associated NlpC family hydrolase
MIEPQYHSTFHKRQDIENFQQRAQNQRRRHQQFNQLIVHIRQFTQSFFTSPVRTVRQLPLRYLLHGIVALVVPIALGLSHVSTWQGTRPIAQNEHTFADTPAGVGPVNFGAEIAKGQRLGDPPLPDTDALPMPISFVSRREALAPVAVPAKVLFENARIRNGPGLDYDNVGTLTSKSNLEVVGRHGEWLQVRRNKNSATYWIASELLDIPRSAIYTLVEIPDTDIPAPPPPKIGTVSENQLNLRDGPGTNYVSMVGLEAGTTFALIERYQDWVHVASDEYDGWAKQEFLDINAEIMKRVPATESIPDANPPLVGELTDDLINLREGPGKVYHMVGSYNAGTTVELLARYNDWYKVQAGDTAGWVFGDLLSISPMAHRRIPTTDDIPPEPAPVQVARVAINDYVNNNDDVDSNTYVDSNDDVESNTYGDNNTYVSSDSSDEVSDGGGYATVRSYGAVDIPASGDVASYAMQFVGYPYVYGGASPGSGFDCSGLMQYVYQQYGVYLPRVAASQYSTAYGAAVGGMGSLAPGDLMFFEGTAGPGISHVAMYIGGGSMVHAMTPGLGVGVSNIWEGYWVGHYYGAIRPYR